jgi:hypothetical protein
VCGCVVPAVSKNEYKGTVFVIDHGQWEAMPKNKQLCTWIKNSWACSSPTLVEKM